MNDLSHTIVRIRVARGTDHVRAGLLYPKSSDPKSASACKTGPAR